MRAYLPIHRPRWQRRVNRLATVCGSVLMQMPLMGTVKFRVHEMSGTDQDFVVEPSRHEPGFFLMTGGKIGIRKGDRILLNPSSEPRLYQIIEIEYYLDHPDLWMAKLILCPSSHH